MSEMFEETWELLDGAYRLEWKEERGVGVVLRIVRAEDGEVLDKNLWFETWTTIPELREESLRELREKLNKLGEMYPNDIELLMGVSSSMGYDSCMEDNNVH